MRKHICVLACPCLFTYLSFAQVSGNQAYGNNYNYNNGSRSNEIVLQGDSAIIISANILMNTVADNYVVTLGLSQDGKSVKECNDAINKRIESFKSSLKKLGVKEEDIFVDFISEAKIYDYQISKNKAEQFENGFEVKKNIIVRLNNISNFDQLLITASDNDVYDLVKVDYIVSDIQKIYNQMITAAANIIKQKKETYLKISSFEVLSTSKIYSENFYSVYPNTQYKSYEAAESSNVSADNDNASFVKKEQRKSTTFYYDGISQSGFDNIINNSTPIVGVQYVLELKMKFDIKRSK